jgi:hypothetical protein
MSHRWGPKKCQLLVTHCVALSLALVALGSSDPTSGFCLGTLSVGKPLGNHGAHLGYGYHIPCYRSWCDVRGVGEVCKLGLQSPLLRLVRAQPVYLGCDTAGL